MLVHYLNVPSLEDSGKCSPLLCAVADRHDSVRWSRDDLLNQLKPMCKKRVLLLPVLQNIILCSVSVYYLCTLVLACIICVLCSVSVYYLCTL